MERKAGKTCECQGVAAEARVAGPLRKLVLSGGGALPERA